MERYFYRLKKAMYREAVDLRMFADEIVEAVTSTVEFLLLGSVNVEKDHFSYVVAGKPSRSSLQRMGKKISFIEKNLRSLVTEYRKSRQLFLRMKDPEVARLPMEHRRLEIPQE